MRRLPQAKPPPELRVCGILEVKAGVSYPVPSGWDTHV